MKSLKSSLKLLLSVVAIILSTTLLLSNIAYAAKYPTDGLVLEKINIRKKPSMNSVVDFRLEQGTIIKLLSSEGKFYKIEYNGKTGYASKDFVQIGTKPTPTPEPEKYRALSSGDTGYEVEALQEALTELRYYDGTIDGKFGRGTISAVKALQKNNKIQQTGRADDNLQKLIYDKYVKNKFKRNVRVKTLPPLQGVTMEYGSRGQAVGDLQKRLKELGYYSADITKIFDPKTRSAVTRFQRNNGINKGIGKANADTQAMIYSKIAIPADVKPTPVPTKTPPMPTEKLVRNKRGKQVTSLQKMLTGLGYYEGKITSVYDDKTIQAVKDFQKKNKLKADGVAGTNTLNLMYSVNAIAKDGSAVSLPVKPTIRINQNIQYPTISANTKALSEGSTGSDVSYMQMRLTELGYYRARNDGKFMADDRAAVMAFQKANGINATGIADVATLTRLYSANAIINYNTSSNVNTLNPSSINLSLRMGDSGDAVKNLQDRLISLGYLKGTSDGKFGRSTQKALKAFQRANKLSSDGIAGASTLGVLYSKGSLRQNETATILKKGDNNPSVKAMQEKLISYGYLNGNADGKFGPATQLALMQFQSRNNLKRDGIAGFNTLKALQSDRIKLAPGISPTPKPEALPPTHLPMAANVRYENWYTYIRALCRRYPNVTLYDYSTGISWQIRIFSTGSHADGVPISALDTENMNRAFGGKTTWTPKPVWVSFSDGSVYIATTHNVPHGTYNNKRSNNFPGHLCIHFPRTLAQVQAIGPYATSHQSAVDIGWQQTQQLK